MKTINHVSIPVLMALLFSACGSNAAQAPVFPRDNPYAPQAGDSSMQRDDVTIDLLSFSLAKSQPPQVMLTFAYFQPTPCHQLRVDISRPNAQGRIDVSAYSLTEKDKPCALMALATPLNASLNLGSFPSGHYTLRLNGTVVGEFDS